MFKGFPGGVFLLKYFLIDGTSGKLQEISVPVISLSECKEQHITTKNFPIAETHLCTAAQNGVSACQGDSGGPVAVLNELDQYVIVGAVSWVVACEQSGKPNVHTRIAAYLPYVSGAIQQSTAGISLQLLFDCLLQ